MTIARNFFMFSLPVSLNFMNRPVRFYHIPQTDYTRVFAQALPMTSFEVAESHKENMTERRRLGVLVYVILFLAISGITAEAAASGNDNHGKEWRQLTETVGLSWNQVAQVCPRDGVSPCTGVVEGRDLTGWVWATDLQVITLFSYYEPDILTSPSISGMQYFFTATPFLSFLRPTFSFAITYQSGQFTSGWTASVDAAGSPIFGSVSVGTTPVSVGGSFSVVPRSDPNEVPFNRGVFLWRDTGLGSGAPFAYDDTGLVPSPAGGTAIVSVLTNDWMAGAPATTANVILSPVSSTHPGLILDLSGGSVDVAPGPPLGTFALVYKICETANPGNCDQATATVIVKPYDILAVNDQVKASSKSGGTVIASVLANDWFAGARATTAKVNLSLVSLTPAAPGITLDLSDGSVRVVPKTKSGLYKLIYKICEIASPTNCSQATASIDLSGGLP